jgi:hypothetical protein
VVANSWGKGGILKWAEFHFALMLLLGMGPQHLLLYAKKIVIRLGDWLWAVKWLGNYPKARIPLQLLFFATFL